MSLPQHRVITRTRERLACLECRRRKLRCDRRLPCAACTRRGDSDHCLYQPFGISDGSGNGNGNGDSFDRQAQLINRLEYLEQLVQNLAPQAGQPDASGNGHITPIRTSTEKTISSTDSQSLFKGATHLSSVVNDVRELRLEFTKDGAAYDQTAHFRGSAQEDDSSPVGLIFGSVAPMSLEDIINTYLPPRQTTDRLLSAYFKTQSIAAPFLHATQFQRQYQAFWSDPHATPPLWLAIVFSICHIASSSLKMGLQKEKPCLKYFVAASKCLTLGEYYRPKRYAVEALLIHAQSHCLTSSVLDPDIAPIFGIVARLGTMMGYHRDPETLALLGLTPFEVEMRRRVWSMFVQLDLLVSFHLGLPSSVRNSLEGVPSLRNLLDSDFDEDSTSLPPSRPLTDNTGMQFGVAKHAFMVVFDKILRHALSPSLRTTAYNDVQALEEELQSVYSSLPDKLKPRPMSESILDPANVIVTRLCVLFIYCKSRCVLHRPYVLQNQVGSIKACHGAALHMLDAFCDAYDEFGPSGQTQGESWFVASLTWHDFLLGAVALCLSSLVATREFPLENLVDIDHTVRILRKSSEICASQTENANVETRQTHSIIDASRALLETSIRSNGGKNDDFDAALGSSSESYMMNSVWTGDPPLPGSMEDTLWNEYLGQYLNLDMTK